MGTDVFEGASVEYAKLHVPKASVDLYKNADLWKNFGSIVSLPAQCSAPTISYSNGKFSFACETQGAEFHYTCKFNNEINGIGTEYEINPTCTIAVYATAEGYDPSETVTETFPLTSNSENGDMNSDGEIDSQDVLLIYEYMKNH